MKRLVDVKLFESEVGVLDGKVPDAIAVLQRIQDENSDKDLKIEFDVDSHWGCPSCTVKIHYRREETESEYLERCEKAAKQAAVDELAERKEFERLKAKFEGGEK